MIRKKDFDSLKADFTAVSFRLNNVMTEMELLQKNYDILKSRYDQLYRFKCDYKVFDDRCSEIEKILNDMYIGG